MIPALFVAVVAVLICLTQASRYVVDPAGLKPTNYPRWAHYQWVWLHNSHSNQADITDLVNGYKEHNIPFGAVNIDSTWATQYNNFVVDTNKFPDFPGFIKSLHDQGLKVTMWVTSMVNVENPDYQFCVDNKYLLRDSRGVVRPLHWWHGDGGLLDYSNPDAVTWWHKQMDKVLDVGIDGFKCDGTDPYVMEYSLTGGALGYKDQVITYHDYASMYYRDFFQYTRAKRGGDAGLIMSRPVDCGVDNISKVCWGFSPRDVMYSGWVGDDDSSYPGMRGCMRKVIYSAWTGYANFGCDVGGYRGQEHTRDLFLRWAQFSTFLPLMENGGGGEHRPWMYDQETLDIYRKFAVEHHRISPYLHTIGANAMDSGKSSVVPLASRESQPAEVAIGGKHELPAFYYTEPSTFSYMLGSDILVHPVIHEAQNKTEIQSVDMIFPNVNGQPTTWLDYWRPLDTKLSHEGGSEARRLVPLESYAVYVRKNAMIPMQSRLDAKATVFTWFAPDSSLATKDQPVVSQMRESLSESSGVGMEVRAYFSASDAIEVSISAHSGPAGLEILGVTEPSAVSVDAWPTSLCANHYEKHSNTLVVACQDVSGGAKIHITGAAAL